MLVFGTQMHLLTFLFVSIETVILFYLIIYRLARPDDKIASLNIVLIFLLLLYNITGGLLPDPSMPGSYFIQETIAYATGFITPCYFPYYVYRAFGLEKMRFHAYKGVFLFLVLPFVIFVIAFAASGNLTTAENVLILPVLYAAWVIVSLIKALRHKYHNVFRSTQSKEEVAVLLLSLAPWVGLPVITLLNAGQASEALLTNSGFLLLLGLQVSSHIKQVKADHQRLLESEMQLRNWNISLQHEVDKRTRELQQVNEQRANNFINLVHETKTPLTLVNNYLEEYINKYGSVEELEIIKGGVNKLVKDVTGLFDIERFKRGIEVYNHDQVTNFSEILRSSFALIEHCCRKQVITCLTNIEDEIYIKADPNAIDRIVNNLIENAIKFSASEGRIETTLITVGDKVHFTVSDAGIGIPPKLHKKIFEPYYQINQKKTEIQGMGLGLPIVKKVVDSLGGQINVESNPAETPGTAICIVLDRYELAENDTPAIPALDNKTLVYRTESSNICDTPYCPERKSILLVEDNKAMLQFLFRKLSVRYNVFCSVNGAEALKKLPQLPVVPDLVISDIMMDKMDGFAFAKAMQAQSDYCHVTIILLSARSTSADHLKGLRSGAIDLVQKPFSFEILNLKIEAVLDKIDKQKKAIVNCSISHLKAIQIPEVFTNAVLPSKFEQACKLHNLTKREIEIIGLIQKGLSYKVIGETLFIAERTVTKHVQNIFEKTGVSNKVELLNKIHV